MPSKHLPLERVKLSLASISLNTIPYMEQGHVVLPDFAHVSISLDAEAKLLIGWAAKLD